MGLHSSGRGTLGQDRQRRLRAERSRRLDARDCKAFVGRIGRGAGRAQRRLEGSIRRAGLQGRRSRRRTGGVGAGDAWMIRGFPSGKKPWITARGSADAVRLDRTG